jgi:phospholipid-binding lipoprotein MlaA
MSEMRMRSQFSVLWVSLVALSVSASVLAAESDTSTSVNETQAQSTAAKGSRIDKIKAFSEKTIKDLKVDANATQPDEVKDPFQPLNRKIFVFNDYIDRYALRPIAVQYQAKIPVEVRGSYRQFRGNLAEPWNATNQIIQWKPKRALQTVGRFLINSITTLGLADPASRLGLDQEEESLGTTLGYYGVSSGPYLICHFLVQALYAMALVLLLIVRQAHKSIFCKRITLDYIGEIGHSMQLMSVVHY